MPVQIEAITTKAAKPTIFPQKKQTSPNYVEKEQNKKDSNSTNKLILTLGGLAVLAAGIYYATRGKGNSAQKAVASASGDSKPAANIGGNNITKNAEELTSSAVHISKEEQELTGLLSREKAKYSDIIKAMENPEKIPTLPENKTDLNGIYKSVEQNKSVYQLWEKGEIKGTISPEEEGFLLKMKNNNSVFIWRDGSCLYYEIAKKEEIPSEIIKNLNEKYISQEFGSVELSSCSGEKNNHTIRLIPLNKEGKLTSLYFTFPNA